MTILYTHPACAGHDMGPGHPERPARLEAVARALSGPEYPAPADWAFADDEEIVQLEARPSNPYSVNLWGVRFGPHYYVSSSSGADWVTMLADEPSVRLRVAGRVYPLSASAVTDATELEAVLAAYVAKYDVDPNEDFPPSVAVFRLGPRWAALQTMSRTLSVRTHTSVSEVCGETH